MKKIIYLENKILPKKIIRITIFHVPLMLIFDSVYIHSLLTIKDLTETILTITGKIIKWKKTSVYHSALIN